MNFPSKPFNFKVDMTRYVFVHSDAQAGAQAFKMELARFKRSFA